MRRYNVGREEKRKAGVSRILMHTEGLILEGTGFITIDVERKHLALFCGRQVRCRHFLKWS